MRSFESRKDSGTSGEELEVCLICRALEHRLDEPGDSPEGDRPRKTVHETEPVPIMEREKIHRADGPGKRDLTSRWGMAARRL